MLEQFEQINKVIYDRALYLSSIIDDRIIPMKFKKTASINEDDLGDESFVEAKESSRTDDKMSVQTKSKSDTYTSSENTATATATTTNTNATQQSENKPVNTFAKALSAETKAAKFVEDQSISIIKTILK